MADSNSFNVKKAFVVPSGYFGSTDLSFSYKKTELHENNINTDKKTDADNKSDEKIYLSTALGLKDRLSGIIKQGVSFLIKATAPAASVFLDKAKSVFGSSLALAKNLGLNFLVSLSMALITIIFMSIFCSVSFEAKVNGSVLGTVAKKSDISRLVNEISAEFLPYGETEFYFNQTVSFSPKLVLKSSIDSDNTIKEKLKSTSALMIPAYCVTVDDIPVFALASKELAREVLESYGKEKTAGDENAEIKFLNQVAISRMFVPKTMLKSKESAISMLAEGKHYHYTAKAGDTVSSVCREHNISYERLMLENTINSAENLSGMTLDIYTGEPIINFKVIRYVNTIQSIPYSTITTNDDSKYIGSCTTKTDGVSGEKKVEAYITSINGVETERDIISEVILSEPIDRVEILGTKALPSPNGTGSFITPASGSISSRYGSRWGRTHEGIDVAAKSGTPIYAADNGIVTVSEYNNGGYGYLIEIDHQNGYTTKYAHCEKLVAKAGDVVAKGDLIAYVGSTGRSTGAHLHFEVRKNGVPCNPLDYLN